MCATACARQGGGAAASPDKGSEKIVLLEDPAAHADGERVYAAWVIYALTKAATYAEHPPPAANDSADDFALELAARKMQADFWSDQKKEGAPAHALLDKQIEISRAGMLPEFVIAVHGRPGWTVPPDALSKLRFEPFFEKFAGSYAQGAPVQFHAPSGKVIPDVPGADFPDPAGLPMGAASCSRALDERKAAWSRFGAVERRLGGVAISAVSTVDFARQLMAAQKEEAHRTRGVTWVSPRVGHLAKLDAFCAVERKDWSDAMRTLSRAVAMRPDDAGLRLEMALALTAINRPDDALTLVTRALSLTRDGCTAGLAWRRRGYILIEKGALDAAEEAYKTSLKYDPKNRIARGELEHIAELRRQRTSRTSEPIVTSVPPFGITITECGGGPSQ
jgi:tetratricopeptide (TPR) repeat protein